MVGENGEFNRPTKAMAEDSIDGENEPPTISPYTSKPVHALIGPSKAKYVIVQAIVDQYPILNTKRDRDNPNAPIVLREVDEDIGHTLIHYLYTGQYQTLALGDVPDEDRLGTEFKRSVLAYCAARVCGIEKLEEVTKEKIDELSQELSIFNLQTVAEEVSDKLPKEGDWFAAQMNKWIKAAMVANDTLLSEDRFLKVIGRSAVFDKAVVKGLAEMYGEQKAKRSTVDESNSIPKKESITGSTKNARDKPDSVKANGIVTHGMQTYVKPQLPQNGLGVVTHELDEAAAKTTTEEYSPMPSEEPSESPFEARRPSIGKSETLPRQESHSKGEDSDVEQEQEQEPQKPPNRKKAKKKKGRKSDAAAPVRPVHDDDVQGD